MSERIIGRRDFIRSAGTGALAIGAAGLVGGCSFKSTVEVSSGPKRVGYAAGKGRGIIPDIDRKNIKLLPSSGKIDKSDKKACHPCGTGILTSAGAIPTLGLFAATNAAASCDCTGQITSSSLCGYFVRDNHDGTTTGNAFTKYYYNCPRHSGGPNVCCCFGLLYSLWAKAPSGYCSIYQDSLWVPNTQPCGTTNYWTDNQSVTLLSNGYYQQFVDFYTSCATSDPGLGNHGQYLGTAMTNCYWAGADSSGC